MSTAKRFQLSWAITLGLTITALTGLLVLTRDLSITNDTFKEGVRQAEIVDDTTNQALGGVDQLPPAVDAINHSVPEVVGVIDSLVRAEDALGTLGQQLTVLGEALQSADTPLVATIRAGDDATDQANAAAVPAGNVVESLAAANAQAKTLDQKLDQTLALSHTIDEKLRIALILPRIGK